jgi:hypothetical protein
MVSLHGGSVTKIATEPAIGLAKYGLGERILDVPNEAVIEGQNYTWTHAGSTIFQHAFRPLLTVTSTSYVKTNTNVSGYSENLQPFWGSQIQLRRIESSAVARNLIGLRIWGRNVTVRLTIFSIGSGSSTTIVASCGASFEEINAKTVIDPATYTFDSRDDLYCFAEVKVTSGTGYLATISVTEAIALVAQMPRGR